MNARSVAIGATSSGITLALGAAALVLLVYDRTDPALYVSLAILVLALGVLVWKFFAVSQVPPPP